MATVSPRCLPRVAVVLMVLAFPHPARAARRPAEALLPAGTLAYVSIADAADFKARLNETSLGQMSRDPQMKPLADELYGAALGALADLEHQLGLPVDEILAIPQGEVAIGVLAGQSGRPALVLLVDIGQENRAVQTLIERGSASLEEAGAVRREEMLSGVEVVVYEFQGPRRRAVAWFERDGTLVAGSELGALEDLLAAWDAPEQAALKDNPQFAAIRSSWGESAETPQLTWFVDPIALARNAAGDDAGARFGLALLPTLGLDGLLGVGGGVSLATEQFDSLMHVHVLLDTPRAAVLGLIALAPGETSPETWVPAEAASYTTLHWDLERSYRRLASLVDSFQGEGAFQRELQRRINDPAGIDFEQDVLPALAGRFSYATWIERPATLSSQAAMLGVELVDASTLRPALDKVVARFESSLERKTYGGETYYELTMAQGGASDPPGAKPCFGLLGNYLLMTDRESLYRKAILTRSDVSQSLAGALEFKLIASKIGRLPGGGEAALTVFNRPEEGMRYLYDLAASQETRDRLKSAGEQNGFLRGVGEALERNPLPPFSVLQQYLAPGGALLTDNATGLHYVRFTLARRR